MLTIVAKTTKQGNEQIDIQVTITASSGSPGIDSVTVTALDRSVLDRETPAGCPRTYAFAVNAIPFAALPIYIEGLECQPGVDQGEAFQTRTSSGPLFGDIIGIAPCKPHGQNQNNQVCISLQNSIQALRNKILSECDDAANITSQIKQAWIVAGWALAAAVALWLVSGQAPWPVNLIAGVLAAAFFVASVVASTYAQIRQKDLNQLVAKMAAERWELSNLISRLDDVCCPEFVIVPRDVPLCPS
jgi:hypothetical protein